MAVELALLVVILVAALVAAAGAWRPRPPAPDVAALLAEQERRLVDALTRLRGDIDAALRDSIRDSTRVVADSQRELALQLVGRLDQLGRELAALLAGQLESVRGVLAGTLETARRSQDERLDRVEAALQALTAASAKAITEMQAGLLQTGGRLVEAQGNAFAQLHAGIGARLEEMRRDNEAKLEAMRATVDERLQATLETRLGESFRMVSDRLEQVYRGLGEMQALATGVGDLKRVLTNVRSRGTFGEIQLGALLEQVLAREQYATNVVTVPGSHDRVEFAIRLPGRDGDTQVLLPIDAKFPQEDYLRLQDAYEAGDVEAVDAWRAALRRRLLDEGDTIRRKYLAPPDTTDFALMFLPTEGLYAEALRLSGLAEELQSVHHVVLTGPTTLWALLNSLQMGFRTLAIEQRSSEVWKTLGAVKTEFARFGTSLDAVGKKLEEASNKLSDTSRRSRALQRRLRDVEALPEAEAVELIGAGEEDQA